MKYKIYTKLGDKGKTSIIGENKIDKHDIRIEAYGTIDELNSYFGLIRSFDEIKSIVFLNNFLIKCQNTLFKIGSYLAQTKKKREKNKDFLILDSEIQDLENIIDEIEKETPPITRFVLPGGTIASSHFQIARTICRRAERSMVKLSKEREVNSFALKYLNRLSDAFFVIARLLARESSTEEQLWKHERAKKE